jgi:hypothetical protein
MIVVVVVSMAFFRFDLGFWWIEKIHIVLNLFIEFLVFVVGGHDRFEEFSLFWLLDFDFDLDVGVEDKGF